MMSRKKSGLRSGLVSFVVLPALTLLVLTFCTKEFVPDDAIYADIELSSEVINDNLPYNSANRIFYGPDGEKYTGEQNWYFEKTGSLHRKHGFVDGKEFITELYDQSGSLISKYLTKPSTDESGQDISRMYQINPDNEQVLVWENTYFDSLTKVKQFFPNGQVKLEYTYEATRGEYDGLMTSYDEDGNILAMERYDMGEMVEKIK